MSNSVPNDPNELYGREYYNHYCGLPYNRAEPHWAKFFDGVVQNIVKTIGPKSVLDAGCAIGFLVEMLRKYNVDALGFDISSYAISQIPEVLAPYVKVGSITDPDLYPERSFDLIVCIEVVEHLQPSDAHIAIQNLCRWGDMVLFSSSPEDYNEATHFNVQLPGYWAEKFAQMNFLPDLNYDASYLTPWAILFRRQTPIWPSIIRHYNDKLWFGKKENSALRNFVNSIQAQLHDQTSQREAVRIRETELQHQLEVIQARETDLQLQLEVIQARETELQHQLEVIQARETDLQLQLQQAQTREVEYHRQRRHEEELIREKQIISNQLTHMQAASNHFEQRLIVAEATLWKIQNSSGWRWITRYRRVKNALLPSGSIQLKSYNILRAGMRTLYREGPFALVNRTFKWLRGERRYGYAEIGSLAGTGNHSTLPTLPSSPSRIEGFLFYFASDPNYARHIASTEPDAKVLKNQIIEIQRWQEKTSFSIITPVYNPPMEIFEETAQSVLAQTYLNWEWYIADASPDDTIWNYITELAENDTRIKAIRIKDNKGISQNSNIALREAKGDFIVLLDHDDVLTPNALYEVMQVLRVAPDIDLIYSDEDKLDEEGYRCDPTLKADWSPELMLCANQITHLCIFRRSLLSEVGYFDAYTDGAQDWDLFFRITEVTPRIYHIPKVLYHWRKTPLSTAQSTGNKKVKPAQERAILNHLNRQGLKNPQVHFLHEGHPINHVHPLSTWEQHNKRKISIIIPSKDHVEVVQRCLSTLFELTSYEKYEVVLVDTGSVEARTFTLYKQYDDNPRFKIVNYTEPFNFSKACNFGADHADGDLLLFLNNDVEILHGDWLALMAQWFERSGVGIVGARLLYPDGKLQHAGVIVGHGGLASHMFIGEAENFSTMFGSDSWYRNLSAVTGACLMISREAFDAVGGFDEQYLLNYSDIELCLQVREAGYRVVYTPHVRLVHHEGATHKSRIPRIDFERAFSRWQHFFRNGDPYYNPNLSYRSPNPQFRQGLEDTPLQVNIELMKQLPQKDIITLPDDLMMDPSSLFEIDR